MVLDRKFGTRIYPWYYNRGKVAGKDLSPGAMGFIYNQTLRRQHNRALGLSVFISALTILLGSFTVLDLIAEFFAIFVEAWVMLPGFWLGSKLYEKVLLRQDEIFEALDNRADFGTGVRSYLSGIRARLLGLLPSRRAATQTTAPTGKDGIAPSGVSPTPSLSASEILRRHAEGRKI
jgi:hypothetical protein